MYGKLLFLLSFFIAGGVLSQSQKSYKIFLVQDSVKTEIRKGVMNDIHLKAAPFSFEVHLYRLKVIGLFAAVPDTFYRTADTAEFPTCMMLGGIGIADGLFNEDKSVYVDDVYDDGCNFWYYDSMSDHRFDKIKYASKDTVIAVRTIQNFFYSKNRKSYKVKQQKQDLYFVFFDMDTETCSTEGFELNGIPDRRYLRLIFNKK